MNITTTSPDFHDVILGLDADLAQPDEWQRRALAWANFAERQRSCGFRIAIGRPL